MVANRSDAFELDEHEPKFKPEPAILGDVEQ